MRQRSHRSSDVFTSTDVALTYRSSIDIRYDALRREKEHADLLQQIKAWLRAHRLRYVPRII